MVLGNISFMDSIFIEFDCSIGYYFDSVYKDFKEKIKDRVCFPIKVKEKKNEEDVSNFSVG